MDNSSFSDFTPNIIFDNVKNDGNSKSNFEKCSSKLGQDGLAKFETIKFKEGTQNKTARIVFKSDRTTSSKETIEIESLPSESFIVITNERQFKDSSRRLLQKYAFSKEEKTSWAFFANNLQIHYLSATKQRLSAFTRPLSTMDLNYIHSHYFKKEDFVTKSGLKTFWEWFGPILHKIKYQKHGLDMWCKGYFFPKKNYFQ